jgi:NTP pyrophosphatase (non-canonical NTP hydrolase)
MWDPGLTADQIERLDLLIEECSEVIKAASKIKRFGYWSTHNGSHPANIFELQDEIGDVQAILSLMRAGGEIDPDYVELKRQNKLDRMVPFVRFQQTTFQKLFKEEETQ